MNKPLIVVAGLAVVGLVVWFVVDRSAGPAGPRSGETPAGSEGTAVAARPGHLPTLEPAGPADAAPPAVDAALTPERVRLQGILGHDPKWVDASFEPQRWTRVPGAETPTFREDMGNEVSLIVRDGVVVGARVKFAENALSASLTGLSSELLGRYDNLPIGFEAADADEPEIKEGVLERQNGRKLYYRGRLRVGQGEGPWGPEWFVIDSKPLPPLDE